MLVANLILSYYCLSKTSQKEKKKTKLLVKYMQEMLDKYKNVFTKELFQEHYQKDN